MYSIRGRSWGDGGSYHAVTSVLIAVVVIGTVVGVAGTAGADTTSHPGTFVVTLDAEGDAEIEITSRYDLGDEARRDAFQSLQNDQSARDDFAADWTEQLGVVADGAGDETGRDMSVQDASVETTTTSGGDIGVVTVTVTWTNLAAVDGNELTVTEPFASGFEPDRKFTVVAPDGYELTTVEPAPTESGAGEATWDGGPSLGGFTLTAASTDDGSGSGNPLPGFGLAIAAVSALIAAGLATRRR